MRQHTRYCTRPSAHGNNQDDTRTRSRGCGFCGGKGRWTHHRFGIGGLHLALSGQCVPAGRELGSHPANCQRHPLRVGAARRSRRQRTRHRCTTCGSGSMKTVLDILRKAEAGDTASTSTSKSFDIFPPMFDVPIDRFLGDDFEPKPLVLHIARHFHAT